jgi:hypothetical protein
VTTRRWPRTAGAAALAALIGTASAGVAWAQWGESATLPGGTLNSGSLILHINGSAAPAVIDVDITADLGNDTTRYVPLTVANAGTEPLLYRLVNGTATNVTNAELLTIGLRVGVGLAASAAACTGGAPGTTLVAATTLTSPSFTFANRPLAGAPSPASEVLCVTLTVPDVKDNSTSGDGVAYRPGTALLELHFEAAQA